VIVLIAAVLAAMPGGCGSLATSDGGAASKPDFVDGNQDANAVSADGRTSGEPNDTLAVALVAVFDSEGAIARLQGSISNVGDVDVYSLGLLEPGDVLTIRATTESSPLDVSVTVLDDQGRLFDTNDDDPNADSLDSYLKQTVRHEGDPYYLVVSASALALQQTQMTGSYRVVVSVARGGPDPQPEGQILVLDFDGGVVGADSIPVDYVAPFNAADISRIYAGTTEVMKRSIVETVRENFAGLNVTVLSTDDAGVPPDATHSTVFFGGQSFVAYGIAEEVDSYNQNPSDVAVIFTESFAPNQFRVAPTAEEMGRAIGNIGSHEAGHLLGLHHVNDAAALMDEVSPADTFLEDQDFIEAPLSPVIAPLGTQDAMLLLQEILGIL
jgi:hypothetical protein